MNLSKRVSNKQLREIFIHLNKKYFNGALPIPGVLKFVDLEDEGDEGICTSDEILISKSLQDHPDYAWLTLLHEMVHWKLRAYGRDYGDDSHGYNFKREIFRLWDLGAYEGLL